MFSPTDTSTYPLLPLLPLLTLLTLDMQTPLPPSTISTTLSTPPFIPLPGALNIRDLGLLPNSPIAPGLLYRSGSLRAVPPSALKTLGLEGILDLRSPQEIGRDPDPVVEGVRGLDGGVRGEVGMVDMQSFIADGGVTAYTAHYLDIALIHAPRFRAALEWVRDQRGPMLFHCTAGKDRTGILAALLLALAGAPPTLIAYDYALTRIGIEPHRELLTQMLLRWNPVWTPETPGMREFALCSGEFILGFLGALRERYSGVEGYVREELGLVEGDVERVKGVLRREGGGGSQVVAE